MSNRSLNSEWCIEVVRFSISRCRYQASSQAVDTELGLNPKWVTWFIQNLRQESVLRVNKLGTAQIHYVHPLLHLTVYSHIISISINIETHSINIICYNSLSHLCFVRSLTRCLGVNSTVDFPYPLEFRRATLKWQFVKQWLSLGIHCTVTR